MISSSIYTHISFDLDGTIVDSVDVMRKAWVQTMDEFHLTHDFSEYKREIGLPFQTILGAMDIVDDDREIERFYFSQTERMASQIKLYKGFIKFLDTAKGLGVSTSIVTSKPRTNAEGLLEAFGIHVNMLVCGDDSVGSKPNSEPIEHVRAELGINDQDRIIYFGDMLSDIVFCVNSDIDYCHCDFGIYGALPTCLLPSPISIASWGEAAALIGEIG